jgi:hypothetical protein
MKFIINIMRGAKPLGKEGENMRLQDIVNKAFEDSHFLEELINDLSPREVIVLPECAKYLGTDKYNGFTLWQGVSGKTYQIRV